MTITPNRSIHENPSVDHYPVTPPPPPFVPTRDQIENVLGFRVISWPAGYVTACTHELAVEAWGDIFDESYERLEYLGDSVLNFIVANWLFTEFPKSQEGHLTIMRTRLVSGEMLSKIAQKLGLDKLVILPPAGTFHKNPSATKVAEDVFEALVGAVFLDSGMAAAKAFVLASVTKHVTMHDLMVNKNYKDQLMQACHRLKIKLPVYTSIQAASEFGYVASATANGTTAHGQGKTKKHAEQQAAKNLLATGALGEISNDSGIVCGSPQGSWVLCNNFQGHAAPGHVSSLCLGDHVTVPRPKGDAQRGHGRQHRVEQQVFLPMVQPTHGFYGAGK